MPDFRQTEPLLTKVGPSLGTALLSYGLPESIPATVRRVLPGFSGGKLRVGTQANLIALCHPPASCLSLPGQWMQPSGSRLNTESLISAGGPTKGTGQTQTQGMKPMPGNWFTHFSCFCFRYFVPREGVKPSISLRDGSG
jgi:hypothetical protein